MDHSQVCTGNMIKPFAGEYLKFAVLVTGHSAPEIEQEFGDYGELYKALLADHELDEEWHVFYPVDDHFPSDEDLEGYKVRIQITLA